MIENGQNKAKDSVICFNIHNKQQKVKSHKFERIDDQIWKLPKQEYEHLSYSQSSFKDVMKYMTADDKNTDEFNILNKQQQEAKQRKMTELIIQILKLLIRIGGTIISLYIFYFSGHRDSGVYNENQVLTNTFCFAAVGDLTPHMILNYAEFDKDDIEKFGPAEENLDAIIDHYVIMKKNDGNRTRPFVEEMLANATN